MIQNRLYSSAFLWHNYKNTGGTKHEGLFKKNSKWPWVLGIMALAVVILSLILAVMPSNVVGDPSSFYIKITGVTSVLIGIGWFLFKLKKVY